MKVYSVVIGNIGEVARDINNPILAKKEYGEWVRASKAPHGRASGEAVTLFEDSKPLLEYAGAIEE